MLPSTFMVLLITIQELTQYDSDTDGGKTMDAGLGFRTGTDSGATLAFTGTFETSNVTEPITLGDDATYGRWNLIGNPFPSYYLDLYHFLMIMTVILKAVPTTLFILTTEMTVTDLSGQRITYLM